MAYYTLENDSGHLGTSDEAARPTTITHQKILIQKFWGHLPKKGTDAKRKRTR
jgi:hypothetical protein